MNSNGIFITGTGTDVGKTVIAAGLMRAATWEGLSPIVAKPIQTGCGRADGVLTAPDMDVYADAGQSLTPEQEALACRYRFAPACSPHLAAELADEPINLDAICRDLQQLSEQTDLLIVEGAGGWLVPTSPTETIETLAMLLDWPVLVVADNALGVINHTLLTLDAITRSDLICAGVILTETTPRTDENRFIREDNVKVLRERGTLVLAEVPYIEPRHTGEDFWKRVDAALITPGPISTLRAMTQGDSP